MRRLRKSDNNRVARACGATIVNRTEELKEEDVGTKAGLFEIKKVSHFLRSDFCVILYASLGVCTPYIINVDFPFAVKQPKSSSVP